MRRPESLPVCAQFANVEGALLGAVAVRGLGKTNADVFIEFFATTCLHSGDVASVKCVTGELLPTTGASCLKQGQLDAVNFLAGGTECQNVRGRRVVPLGDEQV